MSIINCQGSQKKDVDRLVKLCGMLGSDSDNERAIAARQATRVLLRMDLTWEAVIERSFSPVQAQTPPPRWRKTPYEAPPFREAPRNARTKMFEGKHISDLMPVFDAWKDQEDFLGEKSCRFLRSLVSQRAELKRLTPRQWAWAMSVAMKIKCARAVRQLKLHHYMVTGCRDAHTKKNRPFISEGPVLCG